MNTDTFALQLSFADRRAPIILFMHSMLVSILMVIDFSAFVWLHVVASELDFLCSSVPSSEQCGALVLDGYIPGRVALLGTTIGLHSSLIVSVSNDSQSHTTHKASS